MYNHVEDSGKRQEFNTGSVRDTREGKGRYDLLPPEAIYRLAVHFANGAVKYGDRNWEKGQPLSRYLDSAIRHLFKYLGGSRVEDHLAAAAWNALCCIQTEHWINEGKLPKELDDMNNPSVIVTDEWGPGFHNITVTPVQSKAGPIRMAQDTPGVTLYLKGEPIFMAGWEMQPWMIPFLKPPKPRSPWQRFLGRIGL